MIWMQVLFKPYSIVIITSHANISRTTITNRNTDLLHLYPPSITHPTQSQFLIKSSPHHPHSRQIYLHLYSSGTPSAQPAAVTQCQQ